MKLIDTKINDLKIIKSEIFSDKRGFLRETYRKNLLKKQDFPFDIMVSNFAVAVVTNFFGLLISPSPP